MHATYRQHSFGGFFINRSRRCHRTVTHDRVATLPPSCVPITHNDFFTDLTE